MSESTFNSLRAQLIKKHKDVHEGKMMSSAAIKVNDKVFSFFHKGEMGFRLGNQFDPSAHSIHHWHPLSPFKTKPPLKGWFIVSNEEVEKWTELCHMALDYTRSLKK